MGQTLTLVALQKEVVGLYGKTWHFWQTDRGDEIPLGKPELMGSFTNDNQVSICVANNSLGPSRSL